MTRSLAPPSTKLTKLTFLFLGFAALTPWNCILTALDFFADCFPDFNVPFSFPIPIFIASNLFSFLLIFIAKYFSQNTKLIYPQIASVLFLILVPLESYLLPNTFGFVICLIFLFLMEVFATVFYCSAFAFSQIFPSMYIVLFSTGTGISGMTICIMRIIFLGISGQDHKVAGSFIYFVLTAALNASSIIFYLSFKKTEFYKYYSLQSEEKEKEISLTGGSNNRQPFILRNELEEDFSENYLISTKADKSNPESDLLFMLKVLKKIWPLGLFMWLIYVQTFMMFPGVSLKKTLTFLDKSWSVTLLVLSFNIFDTIGKYLSIYRKYYNLLSTIFLVLLRFGFFVAFLVIAVNPESSPLAADWFAFCNIALFALTNGFTTSCLFVLAPEQVESNDEKETSGYILSFPLCFGILCGTLLALPFKNI